jgi:hypothetical protein
MVRADRAINPGFVCLVPGVKDQLRLFGRYWTKRRPSLHTVRPAPAFRSELASALCQRT